MRQGFRQIPGGGKLWTPFDEPGLLLYLYADQLGLADSGQIQNFTDLSGQGNTPTQATAAKRPLLRTGIQNGRSVARFDGVNSTMNTGSVQWFPNKRGSVFYAGLPQYPVVAKSGFATYNAAPLGNNFQVNFGQAGAITGFYDGVATRTLESTQTATFRILQFIRSGDTTMTFARNGAATANTTIDTNQPAANALYLGSDADGISELCQEDIGMMIWYDHAVTDSVRILARDYMNRIYGVF